MGMQAQTSRYRCSNAMIAALFPAPRPRSPSVLIATWCAQVTDAAEHDAAPQFKHNGLHTGSKPAARGSTAAAQFPWRPTVFDRRVMAHAHRRSTFPQDERPATYSRCIKTPHGGRCHGNGPSISAHHMPGCAGQRPSMLLNEVTHVSVGCARWPWATASRRRRSWSPASSS